MELSDVVKNNRKKKAWYFSNSDGNQNLRKTLRKKDFFKDKFVKL